MIYALLLALPAITLIYVGVKAHKRSTPNRLIAIAISTGIGYWYVLPGTFFLAGISAYGEDEGLRFDDAAIVWAIALVHSSLTLSLFAPALTNSFGRGLGVAWSDSKLRVECVLLNRMPPLLLVSAALLLFTRYSDQGATLALRLLIGAVSARDYMSFENFSSGARESLLALWEIVNIYIGTFLVASLTWQRKALSMPMATVGAATLFSFAASGSRTVLSLALFAIAISLLCRPQYGYKPIIMTLWGTVRKSWPILLVVASLVIGAITVMQSRFSEAGEAESLALSAVGSHNDMFRELVFLLSSSRVYRSDALLFLMTPISYSIPAFLGFKKEIPPHLVDFNTDRAGIDLIFGEGNVFPGLIGDFYICFGVWSPLGFAVLTTVFFGIFRAVSGSSDVAAVKAGLLVSLACYYVISCRNMPGSFGILLVAALGVAWVSRQAWARKNV